MAQRGAPDDWDPPSVVQVTVESVARGPRNRRLRVRAVASMLGAIAMLGTSLLAGGIGTPRHRAGHAATTPARVLSDAPPLSAAAQAYRFPLGCMRITRTPQALAGSLRRRTDPCWRYGVSVTAILHRIHGAWRLALEATDGTCPRLALPALVPARLVGCRR
jgi:hypothetical protein